MSIIINDFEVVVEKPPEQNPNGKQPQPRPETLPPLRPDEVIRIHHWHKQRLQRLWAD